MINNITFDATYPATMSATDPGPASLASVREMADLIDASGADELVDTWVTAGRKDGREGCLTARTLLIAWVYLAREGQPMSTASVTTLLGKRLTSATRGAMGAPADIGEVSFEHLYGRVGRATRRLIGCFDEPSSPASEPRFEQFLTALMGSRRDAATALTPSAKADPSRRVVDDRADQTVRTRVQRRTPGHTRLGQAATRPTRATATETGMGGVTVVDGRSYAPGMPAELANATRDFQIAMTALQHDRGTSLDEHVSRRAELRTRYAKALITRRRYELRSRPVSPSPKTPMSCPAASDGSTEHLQCVDSATTRSADPSVHADEPVGPHGDEDTLTT